MRNKEEVDELARKLILSVEETLGKFHEEMRDPAVLLAVITGLSAALDGKFRLIAEMMLSEKGLREIKEMKEQATHAAYEEHKNNMEFAKFIKKTMGL